MCSRQCFQGSPLRCPSPPCAVRAHQNRPRVRRDGITGLALPVPHLISCFLPTNQCASISNKLNTHLLHTRCLLELATFFRPTQGLGATTVLLCDAFQHLAENAIKPSLDERRSPLSCPTRTTDHCASSHCSRHTIVLNRYTLTGTSSPLLASAVRHSSVIH